MQFSHMVFFRANSLLGYLLMSPIRPWVFLKFFRNIFCQSLYSGVGKNKFSSRSENLLAIRQLSRVFDFLLYLECILELQ